MEASSTAQAFNPWEMPLEIFSSLAAICQQGRSANSLMALAVWQ
jgi:hypothetical protein